MQIVMKSSRKLFPLPVTKKKKRKKRKRCGNFNIELLFLKRQTYHLNPVLEVIQVKLGFPIILAAIEQFLIKDLFDNVYKNGYQKTIFENTS